MDSPAHSDHQQVSASSGDGLQHVQPQPVLGSSIGLLPDLPPFLGLAYESQLELPDMNQLWGLSGPAIAQQAYQNMIQHMEAQNNVADDEASDIDLDEPPHPLAHDDSDAAYPDDLPPDMPIGNPHLVGPPNVNPNAVQFLVNWTHESMRMPRPTPPYRNGLTRMLMTDFTSVKYSDLAGDECDFQGINWSMMGVTRRAGRRRRKAVFKNYTNVPGAANKRFSDNVLSPHESFFRFRRMDRLTSMRLSHFQLRSLLSCPSRTQAYYPTEGGVRCVNPMTGISEQAITMPYGANFSSLTTGHGVLMAGTMSGWYFIRRLDAESEEDVIEGTLARNPNAVTNHLEMYSSRPSGSPHVGICSNDSYFRVMDLHTQAIISSWKDERPYNCSALSKDGRMRAFVGDFTSVRICDAVSGQVLQALRGHRDYGFACAWSDDGWTLATGNQDKRLCIWDARKWCDSNGNSKPVTTIWSEIAAVRGLRFSPVGSGKPVLVAIEEEDFISVIDAQTYNSKQTIDIFGDLGGVDFSNEGRDLCVLSSDASRGGLLQFERCGLEAEPCLDQQNRGETFAEQYYSPRPRAFGEPTRDELALHYVDAF